MKSQNKILEEKYTLLNEDAYNDWYDYYYNKGHPRSGIIPIREWPGVDFFYKWCLKEVNEIGFVTNSIEEYFAEYADSFFGANTDYDDAVEIGCAKAYKSLLKWYKKFLEDTQSPEYIEWKKTEEIYKQGTQSTSGEWNIKGLTENAVDEYIFHTNPVDNELIKRVWKLRNYDVSLIPVFVDFINENLDEDDGLSVFDNLEEFYNSEIETISSTYKVSYSEAKKITCKNLINYLNQFDDYVKAHEAYKKGTQSTGEEWDIKGLTEKNETFPIASKVKKINDVLEELLKVDNIDEFYNLIVTRLPQHRLPQHDDLHKVLDGSTGITVKDIITVFITTRLGPFSKEYTFRNIASSASEYFNSALLEAFRVHYLKVHYGLESPYYSQRLKRFKENFSAWLDHKKAQEAYKQGTQSTAGEWDIKGLTEDDKVVSRETKRVERTIDNLIDQDDFEKFYKIAINDLPHVDNMYNGAPVRRIITACITNRLGPFSPSYSYVGKTLTVADIFDAILGNIHQAEYARHNFHWNPTTEWIRRKNVAKAFHQDFINTEWYRDYKKAQEAYKQGTQSTGGDWDIKGLT